MRREAARIWRSQLGRPEIKRDGLLELLWDDERRNELKVEFSQPTSESSDTVLAEIRNAIPKQTPSVVFYDPSHARHTRYDLYVAFYPRNGDVEIWGYQMKSGEGAPKVPVSADVTRSFVFRGGKSMSGVRNATKKGRIFLPSDFQDMVLGPTFKALLRFEYAARDAASPAQDAPGA